MSVAVFYTLTIGILFIAAVALLIYLAVKRRSRVKPLMDTGEHDEDSKLSDPYDL